MNLALIYSIGIFIVTSCQLEYHLIQSLLEQVQHRKEFVDKLTVVSSFLPLIQILVLLLLFLTVCIFVLLIVMKTVLKHQNQHS